MAFPEYVPTRSVSVGGAMAMESSALLKIAAKVKSTRTLVWADTGYRFESLPLTELSEVGSEVSFPLPRTDLHGWKDPRSNELIDVSAPGSYSHRYTVEVTFHSASGATLGIPGYTIGPFVVPEGEGPLDLDKLIPVGTSSGDTTSIPDSWSAAVAAAEAAVLAAEAAAVAAAESMLASDAFMASKIEDPDSETNAALTAKIGSVAAPRAVGTVPLGDVVATRDSYPNFKYPGGDTTFFSVAESGLSTVAALAPPAYVGHLSGLPDDWVIVYSTDHAEENGKLGMAFGPTPLGPFTASTVTLSSSGGTETEFAWVIFNPDTNLWHIYAQVRGGLNQSWVLFTTADWLTFTDLGIIHTGISGVAGDGHFGYQKIYRFGGLWVAFHLFGGGSYSAGGLSYSYDGISWRTDPRRLRYMPEVPGSNAERVHWNSLNLLDWRSRLWATFSTGQHVSGLIIGAVRRWWIAPMSEDLRSFAGRPVEILPTPLADESSRGTINSVFAHDGKLIGVYSVKDQADRLFRYLELEI